jgi:hypothetical protein
MGVLHSPLVLQTKPMATMKVLTTKLENPMSPIKTFTMAEMSNGKTQ